MVFEGAAQASKGSETMPKKIYDHHKKAGNQGDVVKHIALIAALDKVLQKHRGSVFRYADVFAGYAHNPLVQGNEWKQGIGKLFGRQDLDNNEHTTLYNRWYLTRLQIPGGTYPGSSLIAADMGACKKKNIKLSLWDISQPAIANLRKVFRGQGHSIFHYAASPSQIEVKSADFLLIDPPDGTKHTWDLICEFLAEWQPSCSHLASSERKYNEEATEGAQAIRAIKKCGLGRSLPGYKSALECGRPNDWMSIGL